MRGKVPTACEQLPKSLFDDSPCFRGVQPAKTLKGRALTSSTTGEHFPEEKDWRAPPLRYYAIIPYRTLSLPRRERRRGGAEL